ncbi:MAG: Maf family protein, partial [Bradymonadaceae bacterium]
MLPRLILATASQYKSELFARLGLPFELVAAAVDETPQADESPDQTARRLARKKAEAIASRHP